MRGIRVKIKWEGNGRVRKYTQGRNIHTDVIFISKILEMWNICGNILLLACFEAEYYMKKYL